MTPNDDAPRDAVADARAMCGRIHEWLRQDALDYEADLAFGADLLDAAGATLRALADECDALRAQRDAADTSHATLLSMYNALHAERDALVQRVAGLEKRVELLDNDDDYVEVDPRWLRVFSGTATDDDYTSIVAEYGADAAPDAPRDDETCGAE